GFAHAKGDRWLSQVTKQFERFQVVANCPSGPYELVDIGIALFHLSKKIREPSRPASEIVRAENHSRPLVARNRNIHLAEHALAPESHELDVHIRRTCGSRDFQDRQSLRFRQLAVPAF